MTDEQIIERYGFKDGFDHIRLQQSKEFSARLDKPVFIMFESFVRLEKAGLVKLEGEQPDIKLP